MHCPPDSWGRGEAHNSLSRCSSQGLMHPARACSCIGGESVPRLEPLYVTLYRDTRDDPVLAATEFFALSPALVRGVFAYLRSLPWRSPSKGFRRAHK